LGLAWVVSEPPGIAGLAAGAFFSGEGAGAGALPVCAKAGCKENVSAINETQVRIFVTATSVMLDVGRQESRPWLQVRKAYSVHPHGADRRQSIGPLRVIA